MEYMALTGFSLLILGIMLVATYDKMSSSEKQVDVDSAERAVARITEAADFVYIHGDPTILTIQVYLPADMESLYSFIGNKTVNLAIDIGGQHTDVWRSTRGAVGWDLGKSSSQIPNTEGYYTLIVQSTPYTGAFQGKIDIHLPPTKTEY